MGAVAGTPSQASLLAPYRAVEPFHMRGVDLVADAQLLNTLLDLFLFAKQCFARYLQQVASVVSKFLYYTHLQIQRRLEAGMFASASAMSATAVLDLPKNLKDRLWIRRMVVYQDQRRSLVLGIDRHRSRQLHGALRHARSNDRFEKKPAFTARAV